MYWAHFLHIYQPSDQHPGILDKIVNESYRPLLKGFYKLPNTKLTLNISGALTEILFKNGFRDVIDDIKNLCEMDRLKITGSAMYHAFLPLLPKNEIVRQIKLNDETNRKYYGRFYNKDGFFSPEMGYSPKVASIVKELGYKWLIIDESALGNGLKPSDTTIYKIKNLGIKVFFRNKEVSNLLMGALVRSSESVKRVLGERVDSNGYLITAMDGETFGHHRPGLAEALFEIIKSDDYKNVFISDLPSLFNKVKEVEPIDSTWASSIKDVNGGNSFALWFDKSNQIQKYEWDLAGLAIQTVNDSMYSDEKYPHMLEETRNWEALTKKEKKGEENKRRWVKARDMLDKALSSDPWWWASAKPWWSVEMIEKGMNALYKVVLEVPDAKDKEKSQAEDLYKNILFTSHEWQRQGVVDKMALDDREERRIPMSKRFAATAQYRALLDALKKQEKKAADNREYEQAIKWRDGQYKLEKDLDIYDAVHIMDQFRAEGDFKGFQKILKGYQEEYKRISKGQPE